MFQAEKDLVNYFITKVLEGFGRRARYLVGPGPLAGGMAVVP